MQYQHQVFYAWVEQILLPELPQTVYLLWTMPPFIKDKTYKI